MNIFTVALESIENFEYINCILLIIGLYVAAMVTFKE